MTTVTTVRNSGPSLIIDSLSRLLTKCLELLNILFQRKWIYYIHEYPEQTNKFVLIVAVELLIQSLKCHDIYIPQSVLYNNPMDCLIDEKT